MLHVFGKSSNGISFISPLLAVQHRPESIAKITKQLTKVNPAVHCGRIITYLMMCMARTRVIAK